MKIFIKKATLLICVILLLIVQGCKDKGKQTDGDAQENEKMQISEDVNKDENLEDTSDNLAKPSQNESSTDDDDSDGKGSLGIGGNNASTEDFENAEDAENTEDSENTDVSDGWTKFY